MPKKKKKVVRVRKPLRTLSKSKVVRTGVGLRNMLFEEIDLLRSGKAETRRTVAVSRAAGQIIAAAKLELDIQKFVSESRGAGKTLSGLTLGD